MTKQDHAAREPALVITCEHAGNDVPARYRQLFLGCERLLESHHGFDSGALVMAQALATHYSAPLVITPFSRLLVDLNRSIGHPHLHMKAIRLQAAPVREAIVEHHYRPFRAKARQLIEEQIARRGTVIHISCHSFTNRLNGIERGADIGLLYNPARQREALLCAGWKRALRESAPDLEVRRNFPYEGRNDGHTTQLRATFPPRAYLGIELELNQKTAALPAGSWSSLRASLLFALDKALLGTKP